MSEALLFDQMIQQPEYRSLAETIATSNSQVDPLLGLAARVVTYEDDATPPPPAPPSAPTTWRRAANPVLDTRFSNSEYTLVRVLDGLRNLEPRHAAPSTEPRTDVQANVPVIPGNDRRRIHTEPGQAPVVERRYSVSARAAVRPAVPVTDKRTDEWHGYRTGESEVYADGVRKMTEQELTDRMKAFYGINEKAIQEPDHYQGRRRRESKVSEFLRSSGRFMRRLGVLAAGSAVAFAASDTVANHLSR